MTNETIINAPASEILKIETRYRELKSRSAEELRSTLKRSHRVSDLRGASKVNLISTILSDEFRTRIYNEWCQLSAREIKSLARQAGS